MKMNKSPSDESNPGILPARVRDTAPIAPIMTPIIFNFVTGSFKIKKASITTKIGVEVIIMPALMAEVNSNPLKKNS